jgi:hypothetical protein
MRSIETWAIRSARCPKLSLDIEPGKGGAPRVILNAFDNRETQRWHIDPNTHSIMSAAKQYRGQAIHIGSKPAVQSDNDIILWKWRNSHENAVWEYDETSQSLFCRAHALALDIADGKFRMKTRLRAHLRNNTDQQKWLIHSNDGWMVIYPPPPFIPVLSCKEFLEQP